MSPEPGRHYKHEVERIDHSDLASGRVLYGAPGATSFPVRLASELFQRAFQHTDKNAVHIYDPLCGSGYLVTVIGLRHQASVERISASDADPDAVELAQKNLSLLSSTGIDARIEQLKGHRQRFGKQSHEDAIASAHRLRAGLVRNIPTRTWIADATNAAEMQRGLDGLTPDLILTDLPYGELARWSSPEDSAARLFDALADVAMAGSIVAVSGTKHDKLNHNAFTRLERWKLGKRQLNIFRR